MCTTQQPTTPCVCPTCCRPLVSAPAPSPFNIGDLVIRTHYTRIFPHYIDTIRDERTRHMLNTKEWRLVTDDEIVELLTRQIKDEWVDEQMQAMRPIIFKKSNELQKAYHKIKNKYRTEEEDACARYGQLRKDLNMYGYVPKKGGGGI